MELKYSNLLDDDTAVMMLYGEIGTPSLESEWFTAEMKWLKNQGKKVKVYINSPGGSVFGGYSIVQAIIDYDADTHVVGLAASMAGVISQFGKRRTCNDFAQMMIHMPTGADDEVINIVRKNLVNMLVSRCNQPKDKIEKWMEDETNFDASDMLEYGFVDEVIGTNVADRVSNSLPVSDRYTVFNKLISKTEMKNVINHFQLEANATESDVLNAIKAKESEYSGELAAKDAEIQKLQSEMEERRTEAANLRQKLAENLIDQAEKDGKISAEKKDKWVEAAARDYDLVKDQIESIKVVNTPVRSSAQNSYRGDAEKNHTPATDKDVIDLFENAERQDELKRIRNSDPEKFNELADRYLDVAKLKSE